MIIVGISWILEINYFRPNKVNIIFIWIIICVISIGISTSWIQTRAKLAIINIPQSPIFMMKRPFRCCIAATSTRLIQSIAILRINRSR